MYHKSVGLTSKSREGAFVLGRSRGPCGRQGWPKSNVGKLPRGPYRGSHSSKGIRKLRLDTTAETETAQTTGYTRQDISEPSGSRENFSSQDTEFSLSTNADDEVAQLKRWIEDNGGYVHPDLVISCDTPSGTRGVVALLDIPAEDEPLVIVPQRLYMTPLDAEARLKEKLHSRSPFTPPLSRLIPFDQLALLLAYERTLGAESFWHPYIAALPTAIACGWHLAPAELESALASLGPELASSWGPQIESARVAVRQRAKHIAQVYGASLNSVTQEDVLWAFGCLFSRAFGSGEHMGLAPYIDLLNHLAGSLKPIPYEFEGLEDYLQSNTTAGETQPLEQLCWAVTTVDPEGYDPEDDATGGIVRLRRGEELTINYVDKGEEPVTMFLNMGFVAPEIIMHSNTR